MEQLLRRTLGEHIECEFQLDGGLWLASVDPGQLGVCPAQSRAQRARRHAIRRQADGRGAQHLARRIRCGRQWRSAARRLRHGRRDRYRQRHAAEVAGRAFEPFFTTKEVGKGTGLGLSMVYGFAQQSGGSMQIRSGPGQGTAVRLFFPAQARRKRTPRRPSVQRATAAGNETILVVEDNDMVRAYVESELKALGYRVIVTAMRRRHSISCAGRIKSNCCSRMS